ncbi:MAG: serine/threonine-protein kinase [Planctomycetota bacterium]
MSEPRSAANSDGTAPNEHASATDRRMAELLGSGAQHAEIRRKLQQGDRSDESDDLLSRLNALEFMSGIVGEATDMPERLGDYRITGLLGRGGMGTVYLAWQDELEREVALKVLAQSWSADPTMRQRFRAEARATAALHHRHIVPIYDYGEAHGCLFFAMERVDGLSLDKHIAAARRRGQRPMDPLEAARRFAGVADALGLAHRRRILHRDVKPGNILVASDGTLALTDFGLAKALDQGSMRLTSKSGGFLGTLHYSPPEQAVGGQLSPASDLYSLGVTLFEAVSGELPLHGKTTEAVLQSILYNEPRRLREVFPRPPRDLEAVLDKLLCREPGDRYQDGEELARDLARIADGDPVHIRRQPLLVKLYRRMRKNPVLSGAIVAAAVLLFVTFFLIGVLRQEKGVSLISRHQNNLVAVANSVRAEMGSPWGPPQLLRCLVGGAPVPEEPASASMLQALDALHDEMPDDPMVDKMRQGYLEDPLAIATERLRHGRGFEALVLFDRAIADESKQLAGRTFADLSIDLRLYRLYLGRAVANLTATVMRPGGARRDLDLASFLRPGAVFPRALAVLLELIESEDLPATLDLLERDLQSAGSDRAAVIARLLATAAGMEVAADANLMPFALTHAQRRRVHALALRYLDRSPPETVPAGTPSGRAAEIERLTGELVARLGETSVTSGIFDRLRVVAEHGVHPQSALQGCFGTAQLLERPQATVPMITGGGQPLSPTQQLAAWDVLQRIAPPPALVEQLLPRFETLRADHPGLPGMRRTAALLHLAARSPRAHGLADAWVRDEAEDPAALRCRMVASLRLGDVEAVLDDAMAMVQNAGDRDAALAAIVRECEAAQGDAPLPARARIGELLATFRGLLR